MTWEEACRILGVDETATQADIKEQYLYKVQLLHPDKTLDKPEKIRQKAEEELVRINEIYKFLSDDKNNPCNPPKLEIVPSMVRFAEVALNQKKETIIEIKNAGGPFTNCWIDNSPAPWLAVTGVKAATNEAMPLLVTIEAHGLPAVVRSERCSITVRLKNEKTGLVDEAAIGVEIVPTPLVAKLKVSKRKIKFRDVPPGTVVSYVLEISNSGPDTLHGSVASNSPWLTASQSDIVLPKRTRSRCTLNVDTGNLPAGFRETGRISICTNGGETVVSVELRLAAYQRQGQTQAASSGSGGYGQNSKNYGGLYTTAPTPRARRRGGCFWFFKFIMLFIVTFAVGLAAIALFMTLFMDGKSPDLGGVLGWGAITLIISFIVAKISG